MALYDIFDCFGDIELNCSPFFLIEIINKTEKSQLNTSAAYQCCNTIRLFLLHIQHVRQHILHNVGTYDAFDVPSVASHAASAAHDAEIAFIRCSPGTLYICLAG